MSIANVSSSNVTSTAVVAVTEAKTQPEITDKNEPNTRAVKDGVNTENNGTVTNKKQLSEDELKNITGELNNCMQAMNTDIGFLLHTETGTLIVQVEDIKTHKVLKEYPAQEFLDRIARIRDCVGVFLDQMA